MKVQRSCRPTRITYRITDRIDNSRREIVRNRTQLVKSGELILDTPAPETSLTEFLSQAFHQFLHLGPLFRRFRYLDRTIFSQASLASAVGFSHDQCLVQ